MNKALRVLVAGGRDFNDYEKVSMMLGHLNIKSIVSGMARGADMMGVKYANQNNLPVEEFYADWDKFGKSAGYKRNTKMLESKPDYIIAFWDGQSKGTAHCISEARALGLTVWVERY